MQNNESGTAMAVPAETLRLAPSREAQVAAGLTAYKELEQELTDLRATLDRERAENRVREDDLRLKLREADIECEGLKRHLNERDSAMVTARAERDEMSEKLAVFQVLFEDIQYKCQQAQVPPRLSKRGAK